ncbi:hypothetical protein [Miniimonas arenae]|uniref:hypothetical protein n=1 Tax=Miniimonas arenae TaxID=676201 RepID=UPI0028A8925A|nr:hypothetical protein [Miniimonas arenae]
MLRRGAWHWLWAALALVVGEFVASAGWVVWLAAAGVVVAGLTGLVAHRPWARVALWIGLGLALGVLLHLALAIVHPDSPGLVPLAPVQW